MRTRAPSRWLLPPTLAACALFALDGCTPTTNYRYTGLVPASRPLAWDGRTARDGSLRIEGAVGGTSVVRNLMPQLHDTALNVPDMTVEGAATLAVAPGVEIGARYAYASYDWSEPSAAGTMPLPSHPSVWGIGPEMRGMIALDKRRRATLGLGGNFMRYEVPYAEWKLDPTCTLGPTCVADLSTFGGAKYSLYDERTESHYTFNVALYPSYAFGEDGEYGHIFGGLAAHTGFKNDGFTNTATNGSTIDSAGLVFFGGAGYGISIDMVRLSAMLALPFTSYSSPIHYGLSGFVSLGVDLELWKGRQGSPN
jgi:hypothetical protein